VTSKLRNVPSREYVWVDVAKQADPPALVWHLQILATIQQQAVVERLVEPVKLEHCQRRGIRVLHDEDSFGPMHPNRALLRVLPILKKDEMT